MNTNPLKKGVMTINAAGVGTVSRKMLRARAVEIALINGRTTQTISKSD